MEQLIATTILFGSLVGLGVIGFRKIPVLVELPETLIQVDFKTILLKLKAKIITINPFKDFTFENFLHRFLSKTRVLVLKIENNITNYLQKLRENSQQKKIKEKDNYWQKLQKTTKRKKR